MVFYARSLATGFGSSHCSRIGSDGSQSSDCASNSSHACLKTMTTAPIVLPRSHPGQHCEQILLKSSGPAPSHRTRPPAKRRNDHPSSGTGPSRRKRRDLIRLYRLQFGYGVPVATDGDIDPPQARSRKLPDRRAAESTRSSSKHIRARSIEAATAMRRTPSLDRYRRIVDVLPSARRDQFWRRARRPSTSSFLWHRHLALTTTADHASLRSQSARGTRRPEFPPSAQL